MTKQYKVVEIDDDNLDALLIFHILFIKRLTMVPPLKRI